MKKILLISTYDAASHQYWRQSLTEQFKHHQWHVMTLPARYFAWRQAGHVLSLYDKFGDQLNRDYDLILATSMCNLAMLKGIFPQLASVPAVVYFHENQFVYPEHEALTDSLECDVSQNQTDNQLHYQLNSIYSAMSADQLVFNSNYNKDTWFQGAHAFLKKMPEKIKPELLETLNNKTQVLPVPIADDCFTRQYDNSDQCKETLIMVWNHRWEYDKGPEKLYAFLQCVSDFQQSSHDFDFKIHIVGQSFRQIPRAFRHIQQAFAEHIISFGYIASKSEYMQVLRSSDVVLSTALHEFQGLAVMEAIACGCVPLVPKRLAYPEFIDPDYCYVSDLNNPQKEAQHMCHKLIELWQRKKSGVDNTKVWIQPVSWSQLKPSYKALLETNKSKIHCTDIKANEHQ